MLNFSKQFLIYFIIVRPFFNLWRPLFNLINFLNLKNTNLHNNMVVWVQAAGVLNIANKLWQLKALGLFSR